MEVRERILQKANELYFRFGIRSITMDEIAAQCGMSKKTIYQFFEDKDALVEAVFKTEIDASQGQCIQTRGRSDNAVHEIFLAMENVRELFDSMHASTMFDLQKHHPKTHLKLEHHKSAFLLDIIRQNIIRGQQEDLYRKEVNAEIIAYMRLEIIFLTITRQPEMFSKSHYSPSQILQEMTDHFLHGLATGKGIQLIEKYKQEGTKNKRS